MPLNKTLTTVAIAAALFTEWEQLAGDRKFGDDPAIIGGPARFNGRPVMLIGQEKGNDTQSRVARNFGMAKPEGYRKAARLMDMASRFGLPIVAPRPGLVPLTFEGDTLDLMRPLAGVALPVVARCGRAAFPEAMLFTHRGLSGPAVLQVSSYWREGDSITMDLLPGHDATAALLAAKHARPKAEARTMLAAMAPDSRTTR